MENSKAIVNSCRNCDARCCRGLAVVLTIPEALKLLEETGAQPEAILEFRKDVDSRATPHYPLLVRNGPKVEEFFIIIKREKHDCIFLFPDNRCKIYAHRPYVCRLYPFELDGSGPKKGALCPFRFEREAEQAEDAKRLVGDLFEHEVMMRKWNVERGSKGERPKMKLFLEYFGKKKGEKERKRKK
jgi:Fe-S-cluster containining protein